MKTNTGKLKDIQSCINAKDGLYYIPRKNVDKFERDSKNEGKDTQPIMTYGDYIVYLKSDCTPMVNIPLAKFNFTSGTFEKKWGPEHKTIVLTPNHSSIRKVEIEIQGMNIHKMRLLKDKTGDVLEDMAHIKITRHYRFAEGTRENKSDRYSASPGKRKAKVMVNINE
ncbi:MAG: hypothetical protein AABY01_02285 [Nanoarchaeota archaeon]